MCVCVYVCVKTIISETRFIELFVAAYIFQMFVPHIDRSLLFSRCHVPFFGLFHPTSFVKLPGVKSFKQHFSDENLKLHSAIYSRTQSSRTCKISCHSDGQSRLTGAPTTERGKSNPCIAHDVGTIYGAELQNRPRHSPANQNIGTKEPINMFHWWLRETYLFAIHVFETICRRWSIF